MLKNNYVRRGMYLFADQRPRLLKLTLAEAEEKGLPKPRSMDEVLREIVDAGIGKVFATALVERGF